MPNPSWDFFWGGRDQLYKSIRFEIRALFDLERLRTK